MIPYLICFSLTGIFAFVNDYSLQKQRKILVVLSALCVIMIPAILAGFRNYMIGTDTNFYVVPTFNLARNYTSLSDWISAFGIPGITQNLEHGFLLLIYFVSRISSDAHIALFVIALIEEVFVYLAIYKLRSQCNIFIGEVIFLLTLYNAFYNMVRQGIAMSICLYALAVLISDDKKKYLKFFLWIIIAMQFHGSAIISVLFFVLYILFRDAKESDILKKLGLVLLLIILVAAFVSVVEYMVNAGLIPMHYLQYLKGGSAYSSAKISLLGLIIYSSSYIVLLAGRKYLGNNGSLYIAIACMDIGFILLSNVSFYLYRIAAYFLFVRVFSLSQRSLYRIDSQRNIWNNPYVLYSETLITTILYFVYFILVSNWHQTIPYIFMNNY